ncbi:MAG: arginine--tRNA ligase [Campylobacteraceae bacterium]|nr:arginine--tRNA ligase [Campylobacteraceae bacterium]
MQNIVKKHIEEVLERNVVLEKPKNKSLGHYATPLAFSLAKELRKSPIMIAEELASQFKNIEIFESVQAIKGFLNFKLSSSFIEKLADKALENQEDFCKKEKQNTNILLEYVSANPTGPLHIGHARGAILGDTLTRVGRHLGYDILKEYYINDAGSQMDLLGLSVSLAAKEFIYEEKVEYPETYYRGEYLLDIAKAVIDKFGKDIIYDESKYRDIAFFAKDKVLEIIVNDLKNVGIEFDSFVSESALYENWENTKKALEDNGSLYTKDKKLWIKSTELGDDVDRVVVRENGIPTYLAGDIIYHKDKFDRSFDTCINIWGSDHHGYIKRVKAAIKFSGFDPDKLEVILSQMVSLLRGGEPYKMSKRAGNVILFSDIAEEIGSDALRFIFLTKKSDTHLEFDLDRLKNHDSSNPIFYINYAHARINQVFKKAEVKMNEVLTYKLENMNDDAINLVYEALLLPSILEEAFSKRDMQKVTDYLYTLSASLHKFYNDHKIVGSENQECNLKTLAMVSLSIRTGLRLLGITAKDTM